MAKISPQRQKLEDILRSSKIVAGGFMGTDRRSLTEIIEDDRAKLEGLGITIDELAETMQLITDRATGALGNWINIDQKRDAIIDEARGSLICPWPHQGRYVKRITTVRLVESGETYRWSDLNIHLIAEHGFFQGKGSIFRIDPEKIIEFVF